MIDLGYQGADFTWSNGRVRERLDRCFCNGDWRLCFPEAKVVHLLKTRSNHCPVLVKLQSVTSNTRLNPPFWFQAMWMQHAEYADFVQHSWSNSDISFLEKTSILAAKLND